jgi:hypothetical protein
LKNNSSAYRLLTMTSQVAEKSLKAVPILQVLRRKESS